MSELETGIKNVRNVLRYTIGKGSIAEIPAILESRRSANADYVVFFIDEYFQSAPQLLQNLGIEEKDSVVFVSTECEPTTERIDRYVDELASKGLPQPATIVGMGGGATMDVAKAVSNLITNGGKAEDYQGWDLVKVPGIYKIAIPTISGTGAEATRTCVMTNTRTGLKLGMNSDFTVYDQIIMDPDLTATVPRNQYFFTGMDAYIHCVECLSGSYRNAIGDAYCRETISLCRQVFATQDMMIEAHREELMVASYLGGCAIATSYVGLIHPLSAALSVVLGIHHCMANCIVMRAMEEFYPEAYSEFWEMAEKQHVEVPSGVCAGLSDKEFRALYEAAIIHQKPLTNALGDQFRKILTVDKASELFQMM